MTLVDRRSAFLNPKPLHDPFFTKTGSQQKNSPFVVHDDQFYLPPFFKKVLIMYVILLIFIFWSCILLLYSLIRTKFANFIN